MSVATLSVYTIGGGDYLKIVFDGIAAIFNDQSTIGAITNLAVIFGGLSATLLFSRSRDPQVLLKWAGLYVIVTSLMLYPKVTISIEDRTGTDNKPRMVDHVPLALAVFANVTSRVGIGFTEVMETLFHMPEDASYQKTGMLMGSKMALASSNFQITDPDFSHTLNEFMQQCVFYDLLLNKYTVQELTHAVKPWQFIQSRTSVARAFPLNGEVTICKEGAAQLDKLWTKELNHAASVYGAQLFSKNKNPGDELFSRLGKGYEFLTSVSEDGKDILKTQLLKNSLSQAINHYGAQANAPAALQAYQDTKTELQNRMTFDTAGRQAGIWLQLLKNIIEAVLYSLFIFVYFLSYFPFGASIIRNYLTGMFFLQSLAPMYAVINYATSFYAQSRSISIIGGSADGGLSIDNLIGMTQANADAMALASYLMWPVTLGAGIMIFRGMPQAIQGMGQYLVGVTQHTAGAVASETVSGNISMGNTSFGNHSMFNTNAHHFDSNTRYASGMSTMQMGSGSSHSISPLGNEVMDGRGAMSNLPVDIRVAENTRTVASDMAQSNLSAGLNQSRASGEQYATGLKQAIAFSHHQGDLQSSGGSHSISDSTGFTHSANKAEQLIETFRKDHNISHERASQLFGQIHADAKLASFNGLIASAGVGVSGGISASAKSSAGSLYNEAKQYAQDNHLNEVIDNISRAAHDENFRTSIDDDHRYDQSIASSFDAGDHYRQEAASNLSRAESYTSLAQTSQENAYAINGNYTQEFYSWLREQPSIHGAGTMSNSMIDNMMNTDPSMARHYGEQFVNEKTAEEIQHFNQSHHISAGESHVMAAHQQQNHSVDGMNHVASHHASHEESVINKMNQDHPIGSVDNSIERKAMHQMDENKQHLESRKAQVNSDSQHVKNKVQQKVKGKVLGSLNFPNGGHLKGIKNFSSESLSEALSKNNDKEE